MILKFIYSEKATQFCKIFTLLLTGTTWDTSEVKISQNVVAFLEYMNFTSKKCQEIRRFCERFVAFSHAQYLNFTKYSHVLLNKLPDPYLISSLSGKHYMSDMSKIWWGIKAPFDWHTLVYRIDVHARLLILREKSPLHGLILVCTFIDFEKIFPPARLFCPARLMFF